MILFDRKPRHTPESITTLRRNEVFVFGSNREGTHAGGAARYAFDHFGAEWGVGEGPTGQTYAIPTMGSIRETRVAVTRFMIYAAEHPRQRFLVTKIGTGIAGRPLSEIAPLFQGWNAKNVVLPREFAEYAHSETSDRG